MPIARQIAEGIESGHEKGSIHRDLKPANIKITPDGLVKLLDFGLAKAAEETAASGDSAGSLNVPISAACPGIVLGTASYMSPEQAAGKPVDKRSDIWSFGIVLYEMITGRRAYEAGDMSATRASVLTRDVDWKALPADVPPRLIALLRDCLVRDPKQRLRDIGDARRVLDQIFAGAGAGRRYFIRATARATLECSSGAMERGGIGADSRRDAHIRPLRRDAPDTTATRSISGTGSGKNFDRGLCSLPGRTTSRSRPATLTVACKAQPVSCGSAR